MGDWWQMVYYITSKYFGLGPLKVLIWLCQCTTYGGLGKSYYKQVDNIKTTTMTNSKIVK